MSLCEGLFKAKSVDDLGGEERGRGLSEPRGEGLREEHREGGFLEEQRARGLGEEQTELCFGEDKGLKCFGEVTVGKCLDELEKEIEMGEDLDGREQASLWDFAKRLLLIVSPVAWMTLMCCWRSSSKVRGLWRNSAVD